MPSKGASGTSPTVRVRATWWRTPHRVWLRRALFQIHLWVGVLLAAYSVVIGLSGSALVFREEIEQWQWGKTLQIHQQARVQPLQTMVDHVQADRAGWVAVGLRNVMRTDEAALLLMRPEKDLTSTNLRYVYFNQYTGAVVLDRMRYSGVMGWLESMHYYLLMGRQGLTISGWMALGLLILCLSGVLLWWPGVSRWAQALIMRKRARWQRLNWDLHSVVGFWSCALLLAVSFTGVYFAFPLPIAASLVKLTGGSIQEAARFVAVPKVAAPQPGAVRLSIDQALPGLNAALKPAPPVEYIQLPVRATDVYGGLSYYPSMAQYTQLRRAAVDPYRGTVLMVADTHQMPVTLHLVQYFHAVHFGRFAGTGWQGYVVRCLWVLVGITPALLGMTGLLMYWNRTLRAVWRRLRI